MARLRKVESWMRFYGWTNGGGAGSVKLDADDKIIARHGDQTWWSDVNMACIRDERDHDSEMLMDELERTL